MNESKNIRLFHFSKKKTDGNLSMIGELGGKGAHLQEMARLGLNIPNGFTIPTQHCFDCLGNNSKLTPELQAAIKVAMERLSNEMDRGFGNPSRPLLVSVRSGAPISMPGMMDTVLNVGMNEKIALSLGEATQNPHFVIDSYGRFFEQYMKTVFNIHDESVLQIIRRFMEHTSSDLTLMSLSSLLPQLRLDLMAQVKKIGLDESCLPPTDVYMQLFLAIEAVFYSWKSERAIHYRKIHGISDALGTAVTIQTMVFGNISNDSMTGVVFSRDPFTGEKKIFGEYLIRAQGEDIVSGERTPLPINRFSIRKSIDIDTTQRTNSTPSHDETLENKFPKLYQELCHNLEILEKEFKDAQDVEFTIQEGELYILQTRALKRSPRAHLRSLVDMVTEGVIDKKEAIRRLGANQLESLLHPVLDPEAPKEIIAEGLPASPGAVSGYIVFSSKKALEHEKKGCILVRHETSAEDIQGMDASRGILTTLGGMTSHAAVVARAMGKVAIVGCGDLTIDYQKKIFRVGHYIVKEFDPITLDGTTGKVFLGIVPTIHTELDKNFQIFMSWVDEFRTIAVKANADTPQDVKIAESFQAEGVGLTRTEHMFFKEDRILLIRKMILSDSLIERKKILDDLFYLQRDDFFEMLKILKGKSMTIRLLDPPLHEFLPDINDSLEDLEKALGLSRKEVIQKIQSQREVNPMMGLRGVRLGIFHPEIYAMQAKAIFDAHSKMLQYKEEKNLNYAPSQIEILIPLVVNFSEVAYIKDILDKEAKNYFSSDTPGYLLGAMLETPRICLLTHELSEILDFFSFGTNDLTQYTWGLSRDDSGKFLPYYLENKIVNQDPFVKLDRAGVGELMRISIEKAKSINPNIKFGICGEQASEVETIEFCSHLGLDYISCSPYRIPIAKLSLAKTHCTQAAE